MGCLFLWRMEMSEKIKKLQRKQADIYHEMEALQKLTEDESRAYTPDEEAKYDDLGVKFDEVQAEIDVENAREQKMSARAALLASLDDDDAHRPEPPIRNRKSTRAQASPEYEKAFSRFLRVGEQRLEPGEFRALQMDEDETGGFLVASEQFVNKLIQAVDDEVFIRGFATTIPCESAHGLGVPTLETDASDAEWTTEIAEPTEDDALKFGKREMLPHPLVKLITVSEKLLRTSTLDVEGFIRARMAYKFGAAQENAFMIGTGSGQPLGLFVASADGIPTTRDVSTDNSATALTADGLINCLYSLKPQYLKNARWLFHRDAIKSIRKIKDVTSGEYIWQPGLAADKQPSILDRPYTISEYVPNTFTASKYVGMVGDYSFYWIADALDMRIQRLVELFAKKNQVGFIGRLETDAQPVLAEAFARVKLAAE